MSYQVDRARGYQPWAVVNPWVFADYGQPQRLRGQVSPLVYKTHGPYLLSNLGQTPDASTDPAAESLARSRRMEMIAVIGLGVSVTSLLLFGHMLRKNGRKTKKNARRRRARRSR